MSNDLYYGLGGTWHQPISIKVGFSGVWTNARVKFVGKNGKWVEVYDSEAQTPTDPHQVTAISARSGTPYQNGVILTGSGLKSITPYPLSGGAYYQLTSTLNEYTTNYEALVESGGATVTAANGGGYVLGSSSSQYLVTQLTGNLFSQSTLLTRAGNGYFVLACKIYTSALQDSFLFHSGTGNNRIYLKYDSTGKLTFGWEGYGVAMTPIEIPNAITANTVIGVYVTHTNVDATSGTITLATNNDFTSVTTQIPYFIPSTVVPITIGKGVSSFTVTSGTAWFNSMTVHPNITVNNSTSIGMTSAVAGTNYRSAQPGKIIQPNTGKYYIEVLNNSSYDIQYGVAEPGADLSLAPGVGGWCVNTINGRKFDHQTGGGTNWTTAIPASSTIGLLYDSTNGTIEVFVNGVSRGLPFSSGTITVPVQFIVGGIANDVSTPLNIGVTLSSFAYPQTGASSFILEDTINETVEYGDFQVRDVALRPTQMASTNILSSFINPTAKFSVKWNNVDTGFSYNEMTYVSGQTDTSITTVVPNLDPGNYNVTVEVTGRTPSAAKRFTIYPFTYNTTGINVDFSTATYDQIASTFVCGHKQWGGANGGVIVDNVTFIPSTGVCQLTALGDQYTGPLRGVDSLGNTTTQATRIGAALVTRDYFGPGSYKIVAKLPSLTGVASAFWTFHYEEVYTSSPLYTSVVADGLYQNPSGYVVRNHEIDIETPTALKTDPDYQVASYQNARFNTWKGEHSGEYTDNWDNHGVNINDGQYHEFRFDWHLGSIPRVEFYIDGVIKEINITNVPDIPGRLWIALWFPSATGNFWAGATAAFDQQHMDIKSVSITPFNETGIRSYGESYADRFYPFPAP